jgi:hypothetical protein
MPFIIFTLNILQATSYGAYIYDLWLWRGAVACSCERPPLATTPCIFRADMVAELTMMI